MSSNVLTLHDVSGGFRKANILAYTKCLVMDCNVPRGYNFGLREGIKIFFPETILKAKKHDLYSNGIRNSTHLWEGCVSMAGNYIENKLYLWRISLVKNISL